MSTSIGRDHFKLVRDFLVKLLGQYSIGKDHTNVGMLSYSTKPLLLNKIRNPKYFDVKALQDLARTFRYYGGGTRTDLALTKAYENYYKAEIDRPKYKNVLIVMTDGNTNSQSAPYPQVLKPLKVRLMCVQACVCVCVCVFTFGKQGLNMHECR